MGTTALSSLIGADVPYVQTGKMFVTAPVTITIPATAVTGDIVEAIPIKAGWMVMGTIVTPVTAGVGGTITMDVGITGGTHDGFDVAIDLETAVGTIARSVPADTYPVAGGYYSTVADTIDLFMHNVTSAITTLPVFTIQAVIIDCNNP